MKHCADIQQMTESWVYHDIPSSGSEWDDAGRTIAQLVYADDDTVIEETVPTYNKVGDVIGQVSYSRNHDAGSYTGKLSGATVKFCVPRMIRRLGF